MTDSWRTHCVVWQPASQPAAKQADSRQQADSPMDSWPSPDNESPASRRQLLTDRQCVHWHPYSLTINMTARPSINGQLMTIAMCKCGTWDYWTVVTDNWTVLRTLILWNWTAQPNWAQFLNDPTQPMQGPWPDIVDSWPDAVPSGQPPCPSPTAGPDPGQTDWPRPAQPIYWSQWQPDREMTCDSQPDSHWRTFVGVWTWRTLDIVDTTYIQLVVDTCPQVEALTLTPWLLLATCEFPLHIGLTPDIGSDWRLLWPWWRLFSRYCDYWLQLLIVPVGWTVHWGQYYNWYYWPRLVLGTADTWTLPSLCGPAPASIIVAVDPASLWPVKSPDPVDMLCGHCVWPNLVPMCSLTLWLTAPVAAWPYCGQWIAQ